MIQTWRKRACVTAWVLMNTGDQELGSELLRQTISYLDDTLPLAVEHADFDFPEICYLTAGDTERALKSIETQLAKNHLYLWEFYHRLPMYDLIRNEPRYLAALAERERRIGVQRETIRKMAAEEGVVVGIVTLLQNREFVNRDSGRCNRRVGIHVDIMNALWPQSQILNLLSSPGGRSYMLIWTHFMHR